jgi:hypothetical protein
MPVHTVTHNTIYNNALTYGFDYYRITVPRSGRTTSSIMWIR